MDQKDKQLHPSEQLTFSISQVAKILGIAPGTIRNWEKCGLITVRRSESNYRSFTPDDVEALRKVKEYSIDKHMGAHAIRMLLGNGGEHGSELEDTVRQKKERQYSKKLISENGGKSAGSRAIRWRMSAKRSAFPSRT